jgi:hypothetical protein
MVAPTGEENVLNSFAKTLVQFGKEQLFPGSK